MARATAIGLMSGTSYDGVDVALIETDGEEIGRLGPTGYRPYSDPEREVVRRARPSCTVPIAASPSSSATAPRSPAGSAFPWSMTFAPPTLPPAGTARRWCRYFTAPCCG